MRVAANQPHRAEPPGDEFDVANYARPADEPPYSAEAEQSVLGGLLIDNLAWDRTVGLVDCGDFYRHEHREIFTAIAALITANSPVDILTVFEQLKGSGKAEACGGLKYLNELAQSVPSAANIRRYAEIVQDKAARRALIAAGDAVRVLARSAPDAAQAAAGALLMLSNVAAQSAPPRSRFKLLSTADLHAMPALRWRIYSVLPETGFAAVFGPSGSAKSFLIIHFIAAIAEGDECFGHRTAQARVAYVVLEGQAGIPQRVKAWQRATGRKFPDGVQFVFDAFRLTERAHVIDLAAAIDAAGGAEVIVIDTLNRAAPSTDENSSADMGMVMEAVKDLQAMTGGLVVLVHHSGKDAAKGMRGHSSVHAGLDAAIEVSRVGDRREWVVHKAKDGKDGEAHPFRLRIVDLGADADGEPITSCVVDDCSSNAEGAELEPGRPNARLPKGGNQKIVYEALGPLFRTSHTFGRAGAPPTRPCLTVEEAVEGTRERLVVEPRRRGERARQAITGLIATGVLDSNEGWIWLK